jgi:hypothetical protein
MISRPHNKELKLNPQYDRIIYVHAQFGANQNFTGKWKNIHSMKIIQSHLSILTLLLHIILTQGSMADNIKLIYFHKKCVQGAALNTHTYIYKELTVIKKTSYQLSSMHHSLLLCLPISIYLHSSGPLIVVKTLNSGSTVSPQSLSYEIRSLLDLPVSI